VIKVFLSSLIIKEILHEEAPTASPPPNEPPIISRETFDIDHITPLMDPSLLLCILRLVKILPFHSSFNIEKEYNHDIQFIIDSRRRVGNIAKSVQDDLAMTEGNEFIQSILNRVCDLMIVNMVSEKSMEIEASDLQALESLGRLVFSCLDLSSLHSVALSSADKQEALYIIGIHIRNLFKSVKRDKPTLDDLCSDFAKQVLSALALLDSKYGKDPKYDEDIEMEDGIYSYLSYLISGSRGDGHG
jgi:hypothetical protein